jgi:hypothetical protein
MIGGSYQTASWHPRVRLWRGTAEMIDQLVKEFDMRRLR